MTSMNKPCLSIKLPEELIEKTEACWLWQGVLHPEGYGLYKSRRVHRVALSHSLGKELTGFALHKCRNKNCCNPDHLYEGTHKDNMTDMRKDGTHDGRNRRGQAHPLAKLTDLEREEIKSSSLGTCELARRYKITPGAVHRIRGSMPPKLTNEQRTAIKNSNETCEKLARQYGVSASTISNVRRGKYE